MWVSPNPHNQYIYTGCAWVAHRHAGDRLKLHQSLVIAVARSNCCDQLIVCNFVGQSWKRLHKCGRTWTRVWWPRSYFAILSRYILAAWHGKHLACSMFSAIYGHLVDALPCMTHTSRQLVHYAHQSLRASTVLPLQSLSHDSYGELTCNIAQTCSFPVRALVALCIMSLATRQNQIPLMLYRSLLGTHLVASWTTQ